MRNAFHAGVFVLFTSGLSMTGRCGTNDLAGLTDLPPVSPCAALVAAAQARGISVTGIDSPSATNSLHPGDCISALINLCEKGKHNTQWLLYVQAVSAARDESAKPHPAPWVIYSNLGTKMEFASLPGYATLQTVGPFADGNSRHTAPANHPAGTRVSLNAGWLGLGLDRAAGALLRMKETKSHGKFGFRETPFTEAEIKANQQAAGPGAFTPDEQRALGGMWPALMSYFGIVQNSADLEPILFKIVERPSLWSYLTQGLQADFAIKLAHLGAADPLRWGLTPGTPAFYLPMILQLNHRPALNIVFVVTPPRPPLLLCSGIVGIIADKPGDPETRLTLRVLSAHRAAGTP